MFNAFKKKLDVPSQWDDILITTMFKKKGSWKNWIIIKAFLYLFLIIIVTILQLIYEKVLKTEYQVYFRKICQSFRMVGLKERV